LECIIRKIGVNPRGECFDSGSLSVGGGRIHALRERERLQHDGGERQDLRLHRQVIRQQDDIPGWHKPQNRGGQKAKKFGRFRAGRL